MHCSQDVALNSSSYLEHGIHAGQTTLRSSFGQLQQEHSEVSPLNAKIGASSQLQGVDCPVIVKF
jgi:hypothetical protein